MNVNELMFIDFRTRVIWIDLNVNSLFSLSKQTSCACHNKTVSLKNIMTVSNLLRQEHVKKRPFND